MELICVFCRIQFQDFCRRTHCVQDLFIIVYSAAFFLLSQKDMICSLHNCTSVVYSWKLVIILELVGFGAIC